MSLVAYLLKSLTLLLLFLHSSGSPYISSYYFDEQEIPQADPSYQLLRIQTAHPYDLHTANFTYSIYPGTFNCTVQFASDSQIRPSDYVSFAYADTAFMFWNKQWPDVINVTRAQYLVIALTVDTSSTSSTRN